MERKKNTFFRKELTGKSAVIIVTDPADAQALIAQGFAVIAVESPNLTNTEQDEWMDIIGGVEQVYVAASQPARAAWKISYASGIR